MRDDERQSKRRHAIWPSMSTTVQSIIALCDVHFCLSNMTRDFVLLAVYESDTKPRTIIVGTGLAVTEGGKIHMMLWPTACCMPSASSHQTSRGRRGMSELRCEKRGAKRRHDQSENKVKMVHGSISHPPVPCIAVSKSTCTGLRRTMTNAAHSIACGSPLDVSLEVGLACDGFR